MAEQMTKHEQLGSNLARIEGAKSTLLEKALEMELDYYDPDEGVASKRKVEEGDRIDVLAWSVAQIHYFPHGETTDPDDNTGKAPYHANTAGVKVRGPNVQIDEGYYSGWQQATVQMGSTETPTVSIDANGNITVTKKQTEGYISSAETTYDAGKVQHTNLTAANIKDGTTILGIEGTFTEDGTAEAGTILEGDVAYVQGQRVVGTMKNIGSVGLLSFNPLEEDIHTCIDATGGYVSNLSVNISDHLLNRLAAI